MKLILCSEFVTPPAIANEIIQSVGGNIKSKSVAIIPTASIGLERQEIITGKIAELKSIGFSTIDIVDLAVLSKEQIITELGKAHVIMITGGLVSRLCKEIDAKNLRSDLINISILKSLEGVLQKNLKI